MVQRFLFCCTLSLPAFSAAAVEACDVPPRYGVGETAKAIVRAACGEHRLWYRPFIDREGRIASLAVTEAESGSLADDGVVAWQRVAGYWRESGTLSPMAALPGAQSCLAIPGERITDNDCRAFLIDNPWSAAFVSWVMLRAGVPGFVRSPRHIDYIRAAYRGGNAATPYRLVDPAQDKPAPGDLLCFLRDRSTALNHDGLVKALAAGGADRWKSHCEVVVAANVGGDRTLYLVGGNVANAVVMRKLALDRSGRLVAPAPVDATRQTSPVDTACSPGREEECDFNRQDWAALLKLVEPPAPPASAAQQPGQQ
ncbi:DUF2272 domain-containing protein [Stenotrophomonas nitritireducens]|uniref:DUF2272 domain-containing protein n=1 Tax=Stenotrophomonas nitritireducens TaxID=83617 RepID=UPI003D96D3D3